MSVFSVVGCSTVFKGVIECLRVLKGWLKVFDHVLGVVKYVKSAVLYGLRCIDVFKGASTF